MSRLNSEAEEKKNGEEALLPLPVVLFSPPTLGGQSVLLSPLARIQISSQAPSQTHPEIMFNLATSRPSQVDTKLTITCMEQILPHRP